MFAAFPPSSSVSETPAARQLPLDRLADLGRARERDLVDPFVLHEVRAGRTVAGDDVDDARRHLRLTTDVGEEKRCQRRRLGGLQHHGVAACERGRDLPREHEEREVPRDDLRRDAERPRLAVRERVLELVRPACVVEEVRRSERQIDVARLLDRLPAVERLGDGQLARAFLQHPRDAVEHLRPLCGLPSTPRLECLAGRGDGELHILRPCLRDLGQRLLGRR